MLAGIQIQGESGRVCSIGFMGYWIENIGGIGQLYHWGVISAEHCFVMNERIYQNVTNGQNYIGSVNIEEAVSDSLFINVDTTLGWNPPTQLISDEIITPGALYDNDYIDGYLLFGQVNVGDGVTKVGITTGHTYGVVIAKFVQRKGLEYVILADFQASHGDSGGFVGIPIQSSNPPDYPKPYNLVGIISRYMDYNGDIYVAFISYSGIRDMDGYTIFVYRG